MAENAWVIEVNEKVRHLSDILDAEIKDWERRSIYKLPACVTDLKKDAYKPRAVSFGPYHFGELNLKPMEAHKDRALLHFLKRSRKPLEYYVQTLGKVVQDLQNAYDSLDPIWQQDREAFLLLMIRDGCFMLEILRTSSGQTMDDYAQNDPIFSNYGKLCMVPFIKRDMLMLENQLPMLLLKKLLGVDNPDAENDEASINKLILEFCFPNPKCPPKELGKCFHVLDVCRRSMLWKEHTKDKPTFSSKRGEDDILSARELQEAGIQIKTSESASLKDICFDYKRGILTLPEITVDDVSETKFLNLIAFERFHVGTGNEVRDYICFMDNIIDNAKDVNILQSREIIRNAMGSQKLVAELFNSLSKDVEVDPDSNLNAVREMINSYSKTTLHKWRASLLQTYFRNPWASISVIAAFILFGLTLLQTLYSVLQYNQGQKKSS